MSGFPSYPAVSSLAVYSAIYGPYDRPKDVTGLGVPALMFTDNHSVAAAAATLGWRVTVDVSRRTPMLAAKWWKTHPHVAARGHDASVWIDGSIRPLPGFVGRCETALTDVDAAFTPHPWRDCIDDELAASLGTGKYDDDAMRAQVAAYHAEGYPPRAFGLVATGIIARRHNEAVRDLDDDWWHENLRWSWQDQLSLPVCLRRSRVTWTAGLGHGVGGDLPWGDVRDPWWEISPHV